MAEEPVAGEKPWWEQPAVDEPSVEAVASADAMAEEPVAEERDDDPWADFVNAEAAPAPPAPFAPAETPFAPSNTTAWQAPAPPAQPEDDMWGAIAAQTEEAVFAPDDGHNIDLAASLESRMAAELDAPPVWETPGGYSRIEGDDDADGVFEAGDEEEDVILRAFERHAAMPDPEETRDPETDRETQEALAALFGQDASKIVEEAVEEPEPQSFIRLSGFAPQRSAETFDGGWAPQPEVEEALAHDRMTLGTDGAGFVPPPWALGELEADGEAVPVQHGSKTKTWIRELVETGLLALLVFLSVRASFQNFKVDGNSMYPTLEDGQFLIVNKLVYSEVDVEKLSKFIPFVDPGDDPKRNVFHGPQRGDIVVLRDPRKPETDLIKRVIGLPGETVEIVGGKVYINDRLLEEPYITTPWNDTRPKILIPEGEYYVLGDNRDNSLDSRSSQVGLVPKDLIIGKAMLSYWPRDKFGLAPNEGGSLSDQKPVLTTRRPGED
jgi:signal peptidase I